MSRSTWPGEAEFEKALFALKSKSQSRIAHIARLALKYIKYYKFVVHSVERYTRKTKPRTRICAVYVIDAIIKYSKSKMGEKDVYAGRFSRRLAQTFGAVMDCPDDDMDSIARVVGVWTLRNIFPSEVLTPIRSMIRDVKPDTTGLDAPEIKRKKSRGKPDDAPSSSGAPAPALKFPCQTLTDDDRNRDAQRRDVIDLAGDGRPAGGGAPPAVPARAPSYGDAPVYTAAPSAPKPAPQPAPAPAPEPAPASNSVNALLSFLEGDDEDGDTGGGLGGFDYGEEEDDDARVEEQRLQLEAEKKRVDALQAAGQKRQMPPSLAASSSAGGVLKRPRTEPAPVPAPNAGPAVHPSRMGMVPTGVHPSRMGMVPGTSSASGETAAPTSGFNFGPAQNANGSRWGSGGAAQGDGGGGGGRWSGQRGPQQQYGSGGGGRRPGGYAPRRAGSGGRHPGWVVVTNQENVPSGLVRVLSTTLWVGNLTDVAINDAVLRELFSEYGTVLDVNVKTGMAFVKMATRAQAEEAKRSRHGTQVLSSTLKVGWGKGPRFSSQQHFHSGEALVEERNIGPEAPKEDVKFTPNLPEAPGGGGRGGGRGRFRQGGFQQDRQGYGSQQPQQPQQPQGGFYGDQQQQRVQQ